MPHLFCLVSVAFTLVVVEQLYRTEMQARDKPQRRSPAAFGSFANSTAWLLNALKR